MRHSLITHSPEEAQGMPCSRRQWFVWDGEKRPKKMNAKWRRHPSKGLLSKERTSVRGKTALPSSCCHLERPGTSRRGLRVAGYLLSIAVESDGKERAGKYDQFDS
jgi:hypothetical protein